MKKNKSRRKKLGVTLIIWPGIEALSAKGMTAEVIKRDEPRRGVTAYIASPAYYLSYFSSSDYVADAIAANTSGAPLPKANNVTPASDSGTLNVNVIVSKAGDRYSLAVEPKLYMNMYRRRHYKKKEFIIRFENKILLTQTGQKANIFPSYPKIKLNLQ